MEKINKRPSTARRSRNNNTMKKIMILGTALLLAAGTLVRAEENSIPRIAWYGNLADGLAEAERSGRPILLISGAPACLGVPGVW
tara:strand:- start:996 stop:1250 length:255 start_codon:yes stop_codon:yes gene_type:complete